MSDTSFQPARRKWLAVVPAVAFAGLAAVFWRGLSGTPDEVPSVLIGKKVPQFDLPPVEGLGVPGLKTADFLQGGVKLVNVWASWCGPCREEHPLLMELSKRNDLTLLGINHKDDPENARRFLGSLGQPFKAVGADSNGRTTIEWGGYGVPETFVVDQSGIIRYKWIGPLSQEAIDTHLLKEVEKAAEPMPAS